MFSINLLCSDDREVNRGTNAVYLAEKDQIELKLWTFDLSLCLMKITQFKLTKLYLKRDTAIFALNTNLFK